jgi:osmoprotectant transport system ATP-binding protein
MADISQPVIEFDRAGYCLPDGKQLLSDLDLSVVGGETLMLLGRSGSGKTTSLKLINRLLEATSGEVRVQGRNVGQWEPTKLRRRIGYAIQDVGLFPHYTVSENVALVPKLEQWEAQRIWPRVAEVLSVVGLPVANFGNRYPHELSGGQRQRVGLARALAADPPILLMDEPFGALDPITRSELQIEFKQLQQKMGKSIAFVTHDVGEALLLGNRIALMENGKLHGVFRPEEFLNSEDPSVKGYVDVFRAGQQIFRN